jgi:hypothetical protein
MKNYLEILEFKRKSADYHYSQAKKIFQNPNKVELYHGISEFCAMMEVINSTIELAYKCAHQQGPVETKAFYTPLDEILINELSYIKQFVKANRENYIFEIDDPHDIYIQAIPKRIESTMYNKRKLVPYLSEVKELSDTIIQKFINIYEISSASFDQSWRTIEPYRTSFLCQTCGASVTQLLSHLGNLNDLSIEDKEPFLPRFTYVYGHEVIRADFLPWCGVDEVQEDEILIPIDSLYYDVKKEPAPGCCGPDSSTFNIFCRNGHEIGKEAADCWMPHFIKIPNTKVRKNEIL